MPGKPLEFTNHAKLMVRERDLDLEWIERTIFMPDWVERGSGPAAAERRFRSIPERDGRILRVACVETDNAIRVITAFLDRRARRPR